MIELASPAGAYLVLEPDGEGAIVYTNLPRDLAIKMVVATMGEPVKWIVVSNVKWSHAQITHAAIAISDNGNGTIVGWSFDPYHKTRKAKEDCRRKGGQNPKVVARF